MVISEKINDLFSSDKYLKLYSGGDRIPFDVLIKEYRKIKSLLCSINNKEYISLIIYLEKDYKYILVILACLELQITYVPCSTKSTKHNLKKVLKSSDASYLITSINSSVDFLDDIFHVQESGVCRLIRASQNVKVTSVFKNTAYIIYTSGSTGRPKGVMISRNSLLNFLYWSDDYFTDITSKDTLLNTANFTFDLSVLDIAILINKKVHFYISNFNSNVFVLLKEIQSYQITTMATVPNNFHMLLSQKLHTRGDISSLKHLLLGGSKFSYSLYRDFKKIKNINVYNLYGPTEATVYCSAIKLNFHECEDIFDCNITIGGAIQNCNFGLLSPSFDDKGAYGELLVSGVQLMTGYVNNYNLTNEVFIKRDGVKFYKTGDLARCVDGKYYIIGRINDTIKVSGYRVNLSDIESHIQIINEVEECSCIAISDDIKENFIVAFIKLRNNDSQKFSNKLKNILNDYQMPSRVYFINKFPLNDSGKISRKLLEDMYFDDSFSLTIGG